MSSGSERSEGLLKEWDRLLAGESNVEPDLLPKELQQKTAKVECFPKQNKTSLTFHAELTDVDESGNWDP